MKKSRKSQSTICHMKQKEFKVGDIVCSTIDNTDERFKIFSISNALGGDRLYRLGYEDEDEPFFSSLKCYLFHAEKESKMKRYLIAVTLVAMLLVVQVYALAGITNPWYEALGTVPFGVVYAIIFNTVSSED